MKKILLITVLFLINSSIWSQIKQFTIEDVVINSYSKLAAKTLRQVNWIPETDQVSFIERDSTLMQIDQKKNKSKIIDLSELNDLISNSAIENKLSKFPKIHWIDENNFSFWKDNYLISINVKNYIVKILNKVLDKAENKETAPNNIYTAFTIDNNLYASTDSSTIIQVTNETNLGIVSGQKVHRSEFGIEHGIFWSPKSNYLAFYQKDETMVTDYPLVEIGPAPAKLKYEKYPMAGQLSHQVKVGVFNPITKNTVWLKTGEPLDQYLTCVTWDPTEKYIFIAHLNRDQNHMRLIKYDVQTGEPIKTLFEETSDKYIEPENDLYFLPNDPTKFLWFSERDNWQHLYLYDIEGNLIKQVTKGKWEVKDILGIDKSGENIYITATKDSPIEDNAYKVNLGNGEIKKLTRQDANHKLVFNNYSSKLIDTYSNLKIPSNTDIIDGNGKFIIQLNKSENPISEYQISKPRIFTIKGKQNFDLYCRMILPVNFDSTKQYPVVLYVYGGPHVQMIRNSWYFGRYDFWFQYMAQHGYIIFTLDNRGSSNRGLEFEQETFRHLGTKEIEDQMLGVKYLKSLPFVDSTRFGVYGWSYGGFMATSLMLRTNNTFKVGVAGGAVIDWKYYEVMYTERYMDTPQTNPEGYEEASLLNYVQNLDGKLLLVHGTSDSTVVWENTLEFAKLAAHFNKPLDYFPYVGHTHGVVGKDAIHLYTKLSNYFFDNL